MISRLRNNQSQLKKTELPFAYQTDLIDGLDFDELKNYVKTIKKEKKAFEKLVKSFEELTPKEFFKLYKNFYFWDNHELGAKLIKHHLKNFDEVKIQTTDIFEKHTKIGYGSDAFWVSSHYYADYVVYAKKGVLEKGKVYTKREIADLVAEKKLLVKEVECSNRCVYLNKNKIENELANLQAINVESRVDYLPYFAYDPQMIDDQIISRMHSNNPNAFKLIKAEFSKERLESAYQTYSKQFDFAQDKCFKRAYGLIKSKKEIIDGNEEEISKIKSFICNL